MVVTATQTQVHTKRVLMVDDDEMMRILFRDTFWIHSGPQHMIEVATVRTIEQAREYLAEEEEVPNVIFLGLFLLTPGIGGALVREPLPSLEFIKDLRSRQEYAHVRIIVYSKYDEPEFKQKAKEAGADHYLVKGELTPKEIVDFVEQL